MKFQDKKDLKVLRLINFVATILYLKTKKLIKNNLIVIYNRQKFIKNH